MAGRNANPKDIMAAPLNAEERARKEAAKAALQKPSIPAADQALADAEVHLKRQREADAFEAETEAAAVTDRLPEGYVKCRVLRKGHDKIYTGQLDGSNPDPAGKFTRFKYGDIIAIPGEIAYEQETVREHVEVLPQYRALLGLPLEG